ncbi:5-formyltetrahydrofolate cyclo-ligase [Niveispirillum sp.]|uniref:5-formyltetrahydrofolate cyclo-ligase n=1 Tax=Niveispirillum sp. TaxID=1917217 RepID=UPI001B422538|nr:5-formyltetrahydrofolate cyclo-ligase [Niveispirillum sp.]MBP7337325.1 5-formyltetrahydrofolate cyclo-ligase [Niveispirillum sp.]
MPDLDVDPIAQAKQAARIEARQVRARCHAVVGPAVGVAIATHLLSLLPGLRSGLLTIAGYHAKGDEADVLPSLSALAAAGHATALPVVAGRAWPLVFRLWRPGHPLVPGAFRIMEPMGDAPLVQPDIVLVPLLAFDQAGYRLGYGGGFYDRTLEVLRAEAPTVAVGIGYAGQGVDKLPIDAYDQKLDWIVTEQGAWRPA